MRAPVRSEQDAFRLTLASAAAIAVAVLIGWLTRPLTGALALIAIFLVAAIAYVRAGYHDRHAPLRAAAAQPHPHGAAPGTRHVLVVANEALRGGELLELIAANDAGATEVDVLAPVLASPVHLGVTDIDDELQEARARLERSLAWARAQGLAVRGSVGDPSPTTAIEDQLRDFGADEVIVVTHARDSLTWEERGELRRLRRELSVPVTQVLVAGTD